LTIVVIDGDGDEVSTTSNIFVALPFSITVADSVIGANSSIPGGTATQTIDVSSFGLVAGDVITVSNIFASGDVNNSKENFSSRFNNNNNLILAGLRVGDKDGAIVDGNPSITFSVINVGGVPSIVVRGVANDEVDEDEDVTYRFTISGVGSVNTSDVNGDGIINSLDIASENDGLLDGQDGATTSNYFLVGDDGNDILVGSEGDDILFGGAGDDSLTGGAGKDRFVFDSAAGDGSTDTIADFSLADGDVLDFSDLLDGANENNIEQF
jgi:Ca2+-binding RTX toxin-like protein